MARLTAIRPMARVRRGMEEVEVQWTIRADAFAQTILVHGGTKEGNVSLKAHDPSRHRRQTRFSTHIRGGQRKNGRNGMKAK